MDGLIDLEVVEADRKTEPQTDTITFTYTEEEWNEIQDWKDRMWAEAVIEPQTEPLQTCSVNGRPYSECSSCEHFKCTADEPQTERSK